MHAARRKTQRSAREGDAGLQIENWQLPKDGRLFFQDVAEQQEREDLQGKER
jgi:hypothetical protein